MTTKIHPLWKSFALWLNTPSSLRSIATETEWARINKTSTRTLHRWKQDPMFVEYRAAQVAQPVADTVDDYSDEASYKAVKLQLVAGARSGNAKSLDLYFKTYGKPYVEEEVAARTLDLENLDLPDLIGRAVASLAPEELEATLRDLGWTVSRPPTDI